MRRRIVIDVDNNDIIELLREFFYKKGAPPTADLSTFVISDGTKITECLMGATVEWYLEDDESVKEISSDVVDPK